MKFPAASQRAEESEPLIGQTLRHLLAHRYLGSLSWLRKPVRALELLEEDVCDEAEEAGRSRIVLISALISLIASALRGTLDDTSPIDTAMSALISCLIVFISLFM